MISYCTSYGEVSLAVKAKGFPTALHIEGEIKRRYFKGDHGAPVYVTPKLMEAFMKKTKKRGKGKGC